MPKTISILLQDQSPIANKKTSLTGSSETTVDVVLSVKSKNTELRPGYTVNAKIFTDTHTDALTLPYSCIFQEGDKEYVYVIKDGILAKTAIRTGFELENKVEILKGIKESDMIVDNPSTTLHDGDIVEVVE